MYYRPIVVFTPESASAILSIAVTTAPAVEPVTRDEAKLAARWDGNDLDTLIDGLIASARAIAELETRRSFVSQVRRVSLAGWPLPGQRLPVPDPTAVAVSYWDGAAWQTLASNLYGWSADLDGTVIGAAVGTTFPTLGEAAAGPLVRVDITAGAADATTVPACVKTYIKAMVAHWLANPEAAQQGKLEEAPFLTRLLDPVRAYV